MDNNEADQKDIEAFIKNAFEENYERLRFESGHGITEALKQAARDQVLFYWRRLREEVAAKVTDTEVKLNLPGQITPKGRKFGIDGVVDIVREEGCTVMYDIKTHDPDFARTHLGEYEAQLNVYAHIWRNLRRQPLDEAAVILTQLPEAMQTALRGATEEDVERAIAEWNPILQIAFDPSRIQDTIEDFGRTVDAIEEGEFAPPPVQQLAAVEARGRTFAMRVCQDCDGHFSCSSYLNYVRMAKGASAARQRQFLTDYGDETEQAAQTDAGLDATAAANEIVNNV